MGGCEDLRKKSDRLFKMSKRFMDRSDELIKRMNKSIIECYAISFERKRVEMEEKDLIGCLLVGQKLPEGRWKWIDVIV